MPILMWQDMAINPTRTPGNRFGEDGRYRGIEHRFPSLEPRTVQGTKSRGAKRALRLIQSLLVVAARAASGLEIPAQIVKNGRPQRHCELLSKCRVVGTRGTTQMPRHQQAQGPLGQCTKQLRVTL